MTERLLKVFADVVNADNTDEDDENEMMVMMLRMMMLRKFIC